jgi:hypothetical protein
MTNWMAEAGRLITPEDEAKSALVALIGQTVDHQLFTSGENLSAPSSRRRERRCV